MDINSPALWKLVHGIILTTLWTLVADALLVIARYYKSWMRYLLLHSIFFIVNIVTVAFVLLMVILNQSELFNLDGFLALETSEQVHYVFGMTFIAVIVGIQILGLVVKNQIEGRKQPPEVILSTKMSHKVLGYFFYFLSKGQLVLGWYIYDGGWSVMTIVVLAYTVAFLLVRAAYFERLYQFDSVKLYRRSGEEKQQLLGGKYETIVEMIQTGVPKQRIMEEFPNARFVIYKDRVYDVSKILHPGGMLIIDRVRGEEISRYLLGAYGLETVKHPGYRHSATAMELLKDQFVAELDLSSIGLLVPSYGDKINIPALWVLKQSSAISKDLKLFHFQCQRYKLSSKPNILYLGRHFLLSTLNDLVTPRVYTLTLCMSQAHKLHTQAIIQVLSGNETAPRYELPPVIDELPFVIKQYKVKGFSEFAHKLEVGKRVRIEGPFGRGLELEDGEFLAFCGGTGVLPLLDLVYQLLLELYRRVARTGSPSRLPPNFRLSMYLSLNSEQDLQALDLLPRTYFLCKKYQQNLFDLTVRVSKGSHPDGIPQLKSRLDRKQLEELTKDRNITMALVCGSPEMNYTVGTALNAILGQYRVHIL